MAFSIDGAPAPLRIDADGVARIAESRVSLETVITAFTHGDTPDEIAADFPGLALADVYLVIGYCLKRPAELEQYLTERRKRAEQLVKRQQILA